MMYLIIGLLPQPSLCNVSQLCWLSHILNTNPATLIQIEARTSCSFRIPDVLCNLA